MHEFDRSAPVAVVLRTHGGTVDVIAEERGTIEVDVQPAEGGAGEEAAARTRVELDGDTLLVRANGAENRMWRRWPKLRITIKVPAGSSLAGKTASAAVRAAGVYSTVQLEGASADISVAEATGDVVLESASGHLTAERVGGALRAKSASGGVDVGDVTGDVTADTASGHIRVRTIGTSLRASSASGDVGIGMLRQGKADIRTVSGDVEVGVAPGAGLWMDLNSVSGRTVSDLTARGDNPPTDAPVELELRVRTVSGNVRVHRAAADWKAAA